MTNDNSAVLKGQQTIFHITQTLPIILGLLSIFQWFYSEMFNRNIYTWGQVFIIVQELFLLKDLSTGWITENGFKATTSSYVIHNHLNWTQWFASVVYLNH